MTNSRNAAVRRAIIDAQPCCSRCGWSDEKDRNLTVHHKVAVADGGTDDSENLDVLCLLCHKEWHQLEGKIPYREWVETVPARMFPLFQVSPALSEVGWQGVFKMFRILKTAALELAAEEAENRRRS